jgi:hypothetical protein
MLRFWGAVFASVLSFVAVTDSFAATCTTQIQTVQDLQNIQNNLAGNYCLANNIDASSTATWNSGAGFIPIGNSTSPFTGSFDGQGHTISGLTISYSSNSTANVGLFGTIAGSAQLSNIGLTNVSIKAEMPGGYVGALSGGVEGAAISNCYVTGSVASSGSVPGPSTAIGGLVGFLDIGSIDQSYSTASVSTSSGTWSGVGGLVGFNNVSGTVSKSFSTGIINNTGYSFYGVGGFVGQNYGGITDSYSASTVNGGSSNYGIGGFVGSNTGGGIDQAYATGAVSGSATNGVGGFLGSSFYNGVITNAYWDVNTTGQSSSAGGTGVSPSPPAPLKGVIPMGFDPTVWGISASINGDYPYLLWQRPTPFLTFPIPVAALVNGKNETPLHCSGQSTCTAFNANLAAVMDHSGTPLDTNPNNRMPWYSRDGVVIAYTGEIGNGKANCPPPGYQNAGGTSFKVNGNYVGATCPHDKTPANSFLNYDGHSGYDYPFPGASDIGHGGTVINAPAAGRLYKATVDSANDRQACSFKGWDQWHSFYIVHGTLSADGSTFTSNGYLSWYLHVDRLDASILTQLAAGNFAAVSTGDPIAYVGCYG